MEICLVSLVVGLFCFLIGREGGCLRTAEEKDKVIQELKHKIYLLEQENAWQNQNWQERYMFLQLISGFDGDDISIFLFKIRHHTIKANPQYPIEKIDSLIMPRYYEWKEMQNQTTSKKYWSKQRLTHWDKDLSDIYWHREVNEQKRGFLLENAHKLDRKIAEAQLKNEIPNYDKEYSEHIQKEIQSL